MKAAALEDFDSDWHEDAIATIVALSHAQPLVTADDLTREMRRPPSDKMPGAAFSAARTLGYIEAHGYTTSNTPSRHHGVIRTCRRRINKGVATA